MDSNRPSHVVIGAGQMGGGGVRTHTQFLCGVLRSAGSRVTLIATQRGWPAGDIENLIANGVRICAPPTALVARGKLSPLYAAAALPFWIPRRGRDITSACFVGEGRFQFHLTRWLGRGVPAIYHEVLDSPKVDNPRGKCALASDGVIANSHVVAHQFDPFIGAIPVRVIPFLTAAKAAPLPLPRAAAGARELRVAYIGRLAEQKRPDVLVKEWKSFSAGPVLGPARLDVYGSDSGIRASDLNQLVADAGIASMVKIHGPYSPDELDRILGAADVVVLPSTWEGLPLVLVEAMQRGVPVVTTNVGGSMEFADGNSDVIITGSQWDSFVAGLKEMAGRLRAGNVDTIRLHNWAESRYGHGVVSAKWLDALLRPNEFFGLNHATASNREVRV
jgi:glycosyltransferase involved in cell wall biosynthesis